ncbi:MAG: 1,2-diacylglycerol 3-beta-glucosyltransferase [Actinomycetota bacterium]|nr:1,2-diacylglycerol 3-beta-glucosyltransferase [Actinomycetota bacterium]
MTGAVTFVVLLSLSYTMAVFLASRRKRAELMPAPDSLYFVFVLPCLNEELVIGRTLDSLLALPSSNFSVLVINDGSDDRTAEIVRSYDSERVWLLQRTAPNARQGKGVALNAAYRWLRDSGILGTRASQDVIVAILDADGRIESNSLYEVGHYFRNPKAGAVQVGVRMFNRGDGLLPRLQDFEFVTFTEIFQRGRQRMGSVGLGGNGQFTRFSALRALGNDPWTDCLTEDLDLGLRLLALGWENDFCPTTHVSQQAVTSFRRLLTQRSRWFQGHLQCWKRIPNVLFSDLPDKTALDLLYHLLSPGMVLAMSLPMAAFVVALGAATLSSPTGVWHALSAHGGMLMVLWYLLSFGLAPFYGFSYWLREKDLNLFQSFAIAHVYNLYSYLWFPAGWRAVWRILRRKRGWAKTARTAETETRVPALPLAEEKVAAEVA